MSIGKLILHSGNGEPSISESSPLISSLREVGLIGNSRESVEGSFLAGENFLQLISFVGCATNVSLSPQSDDDKEFCHITIKGPYSQPQLVRTNNSRPPICPACNKAISNWENHIDKETIKCDKCNTASRPEELYWGKQAGYGQIFIEISNIFPGEARPVQHLLDSLSKLTGTEWDFFSTG